MNNERYSNWSVTINNPSASDEEDMSRARQKGWKVEGQLERGENGTPHYQLMVKTGQVRFSAVKKAFPRAHIEPARNVAALKKYVEKEETRIGELPVQNDKYPSLSKFWKLVINEMLYGFDKEGLDYFCIYDRQLRFYRREDYDTDATIEELTTLYHRAVDSLIRQGYYVEQYASNPLNKSSFKMYGKSILLRAFNELEDEKTARQTDTNENDLHTSDDQEYTPDAVPEEITLPCLPLTPSFYTSLPPPQTPPKGDDASSEEGNSSSR